MGYHLNNISLSKDEERLLCEVYMDEERIHDGNLLDYQINCLNEIRSAKKYLKEKYDKDFIILNYSPITELNCVGEMNFTTEDEIHDTDIYYELQLKRADDGNFLLSDDYYGVLIREKYDQAFQEILKQSIKIPFVSKTMFDVLMGKEIDGKISIEEIMSLGEKLGRETSLYFNEEDIVVKAIQKKIENIVYENKLYGSYALYYAENLLDKERLDNRDLNMEEVKVIRFNCFNDGEK